MRFDFTRDGRLAESIIAHPRVYRPELLPDGAPPREGFRLARDRDFFAVLAKDGDELLGLLLFERACAQRPDVWIAHLAMLPNAWGPRTLAVTRAGGPWFAEQMKARDILCPVPEYNRLMLSLARRIPLQPIGRRDFVVKDGVPRPRFWFRFPL